MQDTLCVCSDVNGLVEELGFPHNPEEWRSFIDGIETKLESCFVT
jgi:hypothetical protein